MWVFAVLLGVLELEFCTVFDRGRILGFLRKSGWDICSISKYLYSKWLGWNYQFFCVLNVKILLRWIVPFFRPRSVGGECRFFATKVSEDTESLKQSVSKFFNNNYLPRRA